MDAFLLGHGVGINNCLVKNQLQQRLHFFFVSIFFQTSFQRPPPRGAQGTCLPLAPGPSYATALKCCK